MVDVHPMKIDDELEKAKNTLKEAMEKVKKLQKTYGDSTELFE
jgi:predicted translin family RNA/ssDNA-binding protein